MLLAIFLAITCVLHAGKAMQSLSQVPATSSTHAARALLAEPRSADLTSDASNQTAIPVPPVPSAAPALGPQTEQRPYSEFEVVGSPAPQTSPTQAEAIPKEALGACSQEKPVEYIVRGGDHLKFLVEKCGGTDSLEARKQLFSDDELQRWYNLQVDPGDKFCMPRQCATLAHEPLAWPSAPAPAPSRATQQSAGKGLNVTFYLNCPALPKGNVFPAGLYQQPGNGIPAYLSCCQCYNLPLVLTPDWTNDQYSRVEKYQPQPNGLTSWEYDASLDNDLLMAYMATDCDASKNFSSGVQASSDTYCQPTSSQVQALILLEGTTGDIPYRNGSAFNDHVMSVKLGGNYCNC